MVARPWSSLVTFTSAGAAGAVVSPANGVTVAELVLPRSVFGNYRDLTFRLRIGSGGG